MIRPEEGPMKRMLVSWSRGIVTALALAATVAPAAHAQSERGGAPGEWLMQYAGARTLGLGGAFVATANDPFGVLWNPAGLSMMNQNELRFENAMLFEDTQINGAGISIPGSRLPSFGLTMLSLHSGGFERTNELNDALGTFDEGQTAWLLTMSKGFTPRLAIGANVKLVQESVEDSKGGGVGFDLGGIMALTPTLRAGVSLLNVGGPGVKLRDVEESWPMQMRGGLALTMFDGRGLVTVQLDQSNGLGTQFHAGSEYWLMPTFALRMGVDDAQGTGGVSYRFAPQYQVDYAVADHPLGMTHRLGLSYRFGGFFASSAAEPSVFSPTGEHAVTRISLNSRTKAEPESWTLELINKSDEVVRRFGGKGQPPSHLEWDGKDETGLPLADGIYRYHLIVKDLEGRTVTSTFRTVEIATTGPQGAVPVIPVQ
jgi:hypothetical protein